MRVMLDTNILVSMIFFPSKRTKSFLEAVSSHDIVIADINPIERTAILDLRSPDDLQSFCRFC